MKNKLIIIVGIVIVVVGGIFLFKGPNTKVSEKQIIRIGYILPLSGNLSFLGEGMKNSALLALDEINKRDTRYEYQVLFEDDAFSPARTVSAFQKLKEYDQVHAVVTLASAAGSAVNPIAEKDKIIHLATASDPNIAKGEFNFINWTPPSEEVKVFLQEAQKRNIKKIAVFGQQISGITEVIKELKKQIVGTDIQIVYESVTPFGTKDFRTQLSQLKNSGADYVALIMFSPELEVLTKQLREMGIRIPLTAIESFELSDDPKLFEGLWYVNAADPTQHFSESYKTRFQKEPSIGTPNSYDMLGLLVEATESIETTDVVSTTDIARALQGIQNYNGALGDGLRIDVEGFVVSKAVLRMIKDGKSVTIK